MKFLFLYFHVLGAKTGKISDAGHDQIPLYGIGKNYSRSDAERLLRKLVIDAILHEDLQITAADTTACYIKLGPKANDVMTGKLKVEFILLFKVTCTAEKENSGIFLMIWYYEHLENTS